MNARRIEKVVPWAWCTRVTSEMMCSRQVTRLLLRSASVTKDSALAASCGEPLAAGRVRTHVERSLNTESDTTGPWLRLSCAASGKIRLVSVHLCDSGHRASPTLPRLKRGMTLGVGQRSGNSYALNHCLQCGFHAGWCFAVGPRSMGKRRFAFSLAWGRRCSACSTYVQRGIPCSQGVLTSETDPRTSDLCSLLGACMYRTRYQVSCTLNERLETGVRTTSTYSYRILFNTTAALRML